MLRAQVQRLAQTHVFLAGADAVARGLLRFGKLRAERFVIRQQRVVVE